MKEIITQKIENKSWKTIILWAVIVLSIIGVFTSIGHYICLPWELKFTPQNVVNQDINNGKGAIIDSSTHRVLFINNNDTVVNVIEDTNASSNPVFYKYILTDNDGSVYVYSYSCFKNSTYLQNEKITKYTNDGISSQIIKSFDYDLDNNRTQSPRIRHFAIFGDNLSITIYDAINNVFSYDLCPKNEYSSPDNLKTIYQVPNNYVYETCVNFESDKKLFTLDINNSVYCYDYTTNTFAPSDKQIFKELYKTTFEDNPMARSFSADKFFDKSLQQENTTLIYSSSIIARVIYFWISLIFFVAIGLFWLVKFIITIVKDQKFSFDKYKIPITLIVSFVFAVSVTLFYSINIVKTTNEANQKQLAATSKLMSDDYGGVLSQILNEYSETGMIPLDKYSTLVRNYEKSVLYSARSEVYNQVELDKNVNGQLVDLFTTAYPSLQNSIIEINSTEYKEPQYSNSSGYYLWESSTYNGNFINCTSLITDQNNNPIGAATSKTEAFVFKSSYLTDILLMILALIMGVICISFIFYELRNFVQSFIQKQKIATKDKKLSEVAIARPVRLLCMMSQAAECTLATVIVKGMLEGTPLEGNALVMTLPSVAMTLGCFIMTLIYAPLVAKFGIKKLSIWSCVLAVLAYALCVEGVLQCSVLILTIGIFIANVFKEVLYLYTSALPMCSKDEKLRADTNQGLSTCSISSSAIMGVLVGLTVDYIGSYTVYIVAAIPVILMLVVVMFCIPTHSLTDNSGGTKKGSGLIKDTITLLTNKRIIIYILGPLMIGIICSCYRNLIFPIMADDQGMSSSAISNILVLSNALVYYLTMNLKKLTSSLNASKLLVGCQIFAGILFVMFIFNDSILWVIVMLLMSQYFQKLITSTGNTYYQGIALELELGANNTTSAMTQIMSVCNLIANGLMGSAITAFGAIGACIGSGIYGIASGWAIFADEKTSKKKPKRQ